MPENSNVDDNEWVKTVCAAKGLVEGSHHGRVDFRENGKIVVNLETDGSITLKLPLHEQQALLNELPDAVTLPQGWAQHGWTTVNITEVDRDLVAELIAHAIETVASGKPKRR